MTTHDRQNSYRIGSDDGVAQLAELGAAIWRGKWFVAFCALVAVVMVGLFVTYFVTPIFKSDAILVLETREEQVVDLEGVISGLSSDSSTVQTEVEVLRSRGLAQKVVEQLDLVNDPEFNPALRAPSFSDRAQATLANYVPLIPAPITPNWSEAQTLSIVTAELLDKTTVQNLGDSLVFRLTVSSISADKAALIANTFGEAYILNQLQVKYDATRQATKWLTERVAELKLELEKSEQAVKAFQADSDLVDADALALLNRDMKEARASLATAQSNLDTALTTQTKIATESDPAALVQATGDPELIRLMPPAGTAITSSRRAAINARVSQLQVRAGLEVSSATNRVATLTDSVAKLEQQITRQSADLITFEQLSRETEASRLLYEYFLNRLKETSAQQGIQQADSRILSVAVAPVKPALPRIPLALATAALFGLLVGIAVILHRAAHAGLGFRTAQALEDETGKPVLGEIPMTRIRNRKALFKYLQDNPVSATAEALRNLRTSVVMANADSPPRVIVVSSALSGEGKTAVSLSLALKLADLGKKVLLIEADTRMGTMQEYFNTKHKGAGLTEALQGNANWRDSIISEIAPGVDALTKGRASKNAPDLFSSDTFTDLTKDALTSYDTIVFDTAPVLLVSDARIIARVADAVLFVVQWDRTSRQQVRDGINKFESLGNKVTGLVLSKVDVSGMKKYGYGKTYGAYAAYGTKYFKN
ncbi:polysaccharide biosynthesis tyrosine autokinase (plasmid) [Falsihalocynthiibacter sp. SS001]|uniref:polysaccharide biosynthesis tyrosine autokinase n=1 Tax=Falsihalocynthiibacter sp. SS001 TaxID=3349698 RepID=UPI0036D2DD96